MPVSAEVCSKLMSYNMFGIQVFLDVIRYLGPRTELRELLTFLLRSTPWSGNIASLAFTQMGGEI